MFSLKSPNAVRMDLNETIKGVVKPKGWNWWAALFWLSQGARRREFRYIYKTGNPSRFRGRVYLFHIF